MKRSILLAISIVCSVARTPAAPLPAFTEAAAQAWWQSRPAQTDFAEEAQKLQASLLEIQSAPGADLNQLSQNPSFLGWLELTSWVSLYPKASTAEFLGSAEGRAAFVAVGKNASLRKSFLAHLSPFDEATKACEILCRIQHEEPAFLKLLPQAAVAVALVWDQPFPEKWPHVWVKKMDLQTGDNDPVQRFKLFCQTYQGLQVNPSVVRKLVVDPTRLTPRDLMFVVDSPLNFKEMGYILQVKLNDPKRLNDLFLQVPYDTARMSRDDLIWPHGPYRLIDIGKKGGICADQAFFVTMAGKAQGIPSVLLMGQGTTGGHAWVGYMGSPGKWTLDVARYQEGHYASGSTWDPQNWRRITDAQLAFLNREPSTGPAALRGRLLAQWAMIQRSSELYPRLLGLARTAWPRNLDIWELQAACLEERNIPLENRRIFWENWISTFREDKDMRFRGQTALLKLYETANDKPAADKLRALIVSENKRARFDLAISLAAAPVLDLAAAGKWTDAELACDKLLSQSKSKADGNLFYILVQPLVEQAVQAGQVGIAANVLRRARPLFEITPLSTFAVDFKALEALIKDAPK